MSGGSSCVELVLSRAKIGGAADEQSLTSLANHRGTRIKRLSSRVWFVILKKLFDSNYFIGFQTAERSMIINIV